MLLIYFPLVLFQINSFPLSVWGLMPPPPHLLQKSVLLCRSVMRMPVRIQCQTVETPYPTMHLGQVRLGVTMGLVPQRAISVR